MIENTRKQIEKSLVNFMDRVKKEYKFHLVSPILYESIREFSLRKGKRIRPLLLILSYKGFCQKGKRVSPSIYNAATCIELLHIFMLIHDDIIDRSDLRRGRPTMHKMLRKTVATKEADKLGQDLAIIAGDIVYALAIDAFLSIKEAPHRKEEGLKYFIQTAAFTAMGEFIDTVHGVDQLHKVKEKDVFLNYSLKTARYTFDCPLVTGAILAGADKKEIKKLAELGLLIGQAFQIQDDVIGIFGSEKKIGKSILSDLAESKKTLLVCHTYSKLDAKSKKGFTKHFNKPKKTYKDLVAVRKIFLNNGSLDYCLAQIKIRLDKSSKIFKSLTMRESYKKEIEGAFEGIFKQTYAIVQQHSSSPKK
jgi:geranylgeranyl diphosphate synthase type I